MADVKLQISRSLDIITDDNIGIPEPWSKTTEGTTDGTGINALIDPGATFETDNVKKGDVVYNTTDSTITTVSSVDSETQLTLTTGIMDTAEDYVIYRDQTRDAAIYVGVSGNVRVLTAGGDDVTYTAVPVGWQPINAKKVFTTGTTATNLKAGW